jgi:hypothetical protein
MRILLIIHSFFEVLSWGFEVFGFGGFFLFFFFFGFCWGGGGGGAKRGSFLCVAEGIRGQNNTTYFQLRCFIFLNNK